MGAGRYLWSMAIDSSASDANQGRRPPLAPAAFREQLRSRKFTNNADGEAVANLFEKTAGVLRGTRSCTSTTSQCWRGMASGSRRRWPCASRSSSRGALCHGGGRGGGHAVASAADAGEAVPAGGVLGRVGGVVAVGEALKSGKVPQLRLFLANNALGESGGVAVGEALKGGKVPRLRELYLGNNALGESGGVAVGEALKSGKVPQLQELYLGNNALGESGRVAVGGALKSGKVPQLQDSLAETMRSAMVLLQHSPQPSAPACPTSHSCTWMGTTM